MEDHPGPVVGLSALKDNYVWLFATGPASVAAVDPGAAAPVLVWLAAKQTPCQSLSHILVTHHHHDHIDGIAALRAATGAEVIGAASDRHRLPRLDREVVDDDILTLGEREVRVLAVPGHTTGHVVYLVDGKDLYSGDCLFGLGAGRLFEGTPAEMWTSLDRLRGLPEATRIFAGHEYTLANARFLATLEPEDPEVGVLLEELYDTTDAGRPTLPSTLGREKRFNPFLRCDEPGFVARLGMAGQSPIEVFARIRELRNRY
ncbi:MAG: hydroxyacylglutathione hydrolase [Magnetococcales bacterium]|nr:hydroxyacylglutathione hydrolase [Magnetococcales bacterium]